MDNKEALNFLEKSWSKQKLLEDIKRGKSSDLIVNEFIKENKNIIDMVTKFINDNDKQLLNQMETLNYCEIKLINALKIKENKFSDSSNKKVEESKTIFKIFKEFNLSLFMNKWSNQFVIGILIMISLISLTKQAWA